MINWGSSAPPTATVNHSPSSDFQLEVMFDVGGEEKVLLMKGLGEDGDEGRGGENE